MTTTAHTTRTVAETLARLREPPIVGRFYMVPVVHYTLFDRWMDWPVLGPLHHDREHIGFEDLHYHLDGRFLSDRQMDMFANNDLWRDADFPPGSSLNAKPLSQMRGQVGSKGAQPRILPKPTLKKRKCRRAIQPWVVGKHSAAWGLDKVYGAPAEPIRRADGRLLCPHRKVDLSQFPCDEDGVVVCPVHGLRVRLREAAALAREQGL